MPKTGKVYNKFCACGCNEPIPVYEQHKRMGIPNYINHHGMTNKKQSEKTKIKIGLANSIANKGKKLKNIHKNNCECAFCKAMRGENKGIPRSSITKNKISLKNKGKNNGMFGRCGKSHPNWLDINKDYAVDFNKELKHKIRKRDNYKCKICGVFENSLKYKLSIHHIDYNKHNSKETNLISLCKICHTKTNYNRNKWIKILKEKVACNIGSPATSTTGILIL